MTWYPIIGLIAIILIGFGILSAVSNSYTNTFFSFGLAGVLLVLGAFFMLVDIHSVITQDDATSHIQDIPDDADAVE